MWLDRYRVRGGMVLPLGRWMRSLQAQLLLWASLPILLLVTGIALTGAVRQQRAMHDFVMDRDGALVDLIAASLEAALMRGELTPDGRDVRRWLTAMVGSKPRTMMVLSSEGDLLAQFGQVENAPFEVAATLLALDAVGQRSVVLTAETGVSVLVTEAVVPSAQWTVLVWVPVADVLGPTLTWSRLGPIVTVVGAGLSVILLLLGWRTAVRPLRQLRRAAEQVSWGEQGALRAPIVSVTEIRELHGALVRMVERLEGYQAGVLDYLDAVTQGQEAERARLARELHDGPVQSLVALGQRTDMVRIDAAAEGEDGLVQRLDALRDAEMAVIDDLRRIIGAIRPVYLEDLGFLPALEALVRSADVRDEAVVHLRVETAAQRLPPDIELAAYRMTQEALANALQHAGAQRIDVTVRFEPGRLTLRIADNGRGFEPAARLDRYTREGHFGLVGLQERVRQLGGTFTIASAPDVGTVVDVRLPLPATG